MAFALAVALLPAHRADALLVLDPVVPEEVASPQRIARPARVQPVPGNRTGWFGEGRRGHRHLGIDFDAEVGDVVVAAAAGTVRLAGVGGDALRGYGTVVMVDHGLGIESMSAHLSQVLVVPGQTVWPGDPIGLVGMTGQVEGSHLHFEIRRLGIPVDPAPWLIDEPEPRLRSVL